MKKLFWLLIGLLSCISFSSAISFGVSNYFNVNNYGFYQFSPSSDLGGWISDWFMCFEIVWKFNNFVISDTNWNTIVSFYWQDIDNSASPLCFFLSDFSQSYTLMIQGNYQLTVNYFYMYSLQTPQVSCYTWVMNIKLVNWNTNSENNLYYEFSPYSQYNAVYSVYFTWVNATSMQNWILLEWNDCSLVQSDLYTCIDNYSICDWNLRSCQSDLSTATGYIDSLEWEISQCSQDLINCSNSSNTWSCESWSNWSALFINDIQHLWKPNIFITIPEEIDWDYTSDWDYFDLDINGYNVDTEYIDWIIRTQNYKPTTEDFTKLVWLLAPYTKILVFLLFVFLIWAWIKKPFKSKKL